MTASVDLPVEPGPTERLMLALLRQRYTRVSMGAHRYAVNVKGHTE